ncbi:MAG: sigma-70 family RNA polymerase sigma factor [Verrucomicrobia bacterium]|nr:sigma-70 family RNA polymerase sigma factor [Verrucomicrobiota bacterium]
MIQAITDQSECLCSTEQPEARTLRQSVQAWDRDTGFNTEAVVHMDILRNAAVRLTGNTADAEDLLQETLLKAYRAFDTYRPGTNCKAWLFRILRNNFYNAYRKRTRRPTHVSFEQVEGIVPARQRPPIPFPSGVSAYPAVIEFMDDEIRDAINKVGHVFQTTLLLCDVHGLTYREAAEVMSCSIGTVRSRLSRARSAMRKHLENTDAAKRMERLASASTNRRNGSGSQRRQQSADGTRAEVLRQPPAAPRVEPLAVRAHR